MDIPVAIRTNLLLPAMNAGVEVPVAKHSSVGADLYWPWLWPSLLSSNNDRCIEAMAASLEYRYWFNGSAPGGRKTNLTGLSAGVELTGCYFDLEWDYEGKQGEAVSAGVDVTYAFPICQGKMRLELSAGIGYGYIQYREYKVYTEGGELIRPSNLPLVSGFTFVPTKCAVSLVWPLFGKRKGGEI